MSKLAIQKLLYPHVNMIETHILPVPQCCPISKNPADGSKLYISYKPSEHSLEVKELHNYIQSFKNGKDEVRGMEDMIRRIAIDCFDVLGITVCVKAVLKIHPDQEMILEIEMGKNKK